MKNRNILIASAGMMLFLWNGEIARGQFLDTVLEGVKKYNESPRQESQSQRDDSRYDRRRHDDSHSQGGLGGSEPETIVRRAYEDVLNREPDPEGMRTYRSRIIDDHWSEQDVRSDLRKSAERTGKSPAAAEMVVRRAYQDILGRDPDPAGLAMYRNKLVKEGWCERDVRSDLKKSSEYRQKHR